MTTEADISPEDLAELLAASSELAGAVQSDREPACIARVFTTPRVGQLALTMQQWIDLAAIDSPFLRTEIAEDTGDFLRAAEIFGCAISAETAAEDMALIATAMQRACAEAWALVLPMRQPGVNGGGTDAQGFGRWLPLYAALVAQLGLDPDAALALRVDRACALLAAVRHNAGWEVAGEPYATRNIATEDAANG